MLRELGCGRRCIGRGRYRATRRCVASMASPKSALMSPKIPGRHGHVVAALAIGRDCEIARRPNSSHHATRSVRELTIDLFQSGQTCVRSYDVRIRTYQRTMARVIANWDAAVVNHRYSRGECAAGGRCEKNPGAIALVNTFNNWGRSYQGCTASWSQFFTISSVGKKKYSRHWR